MISNITVSESAFLYFPKPFKELNLSLFDFVVDKQIDFEILLSYSYDSKNFSRFVKYESLKDSVLDNQTEMYVCVWLKRTVSKDLETPDVIREFRIDSSNYKSNGYHLTNVQNHSGDFGKLKTAIISISKIRYNQEVIDLSTIKQKQKFDIIDEFPRWNFYDNQLVNVTRWLETCNALAESHGHTVIYFKTEPVETETNLQSGIHGIHYTLANNVIRNVVDVKKLHIMIPSNELPQDRVVFSEWDIAMQDDFMIHVVRQKFEQAFGLNQIPNEKDFIYFPLINKMFRVATMQPKNGFMGVIGWYEVFLQKWEDDEHVQSGVAINDMLRESLSNEFLSNDVDFDSFGFQTIDDSFVHLTDSVEEIAEETDNFVSDEKRIEEEKIATENFTNRLKDSTWHISLKETEKLREFYDRRLKIVSVNPDSNSFPLSMYDCNDIERRGIALTYNLRDYSVNNKFQTQVEHTFQLSFNFIFMSRFNGELFDIVSDTNTVVSSISISNQRIKIFDSRRQVETIFEHKFEQKELYQIAIEYMIEPVESYCFKLFKLKNSEKQLIDQNVFRIDNNENLGVKYDKKPINISSLNMYGGSYLINDITLKIDNQKFIEDKCLPLLKMRQL